MEIKDRNDPKVFKSFIDGILMELALINGSNGEKVKKVLTDVSAEGIVSFWYLKKAATRTAQWTYHGRVAEVLNDYGYWGTNIFESSSELPFLVNEDNDLLDYHGSDSWPVHLQNYPEESHEALRQDFYLDGGGGDVLGVWKKGPNFKIYVATPHEFKIIAEDPIEWIAKTKLFVYEKLKSHQ